MTAKTKLALPQALLSQVHADEQIEYYELFKNCWWVREELVKYFESEIEKLTQEAENENWLESPNLLHKYVANVAERRGIRKVLNVLNRGITDGKRQEEES